MRQRSPIQFDAHGNLQYVASAREDFTQETKHWFSYSGLTQSLCHRVSYECMARLICEIFNQNEFYYPKELKIDFLTNLVDAVNTHVLRNRNGEQGVRRCMEIVSRYEQAETENSLEFANELLHSLNNCWYNLRVGNKNWNASIQASYDPGDWMWIEGSHYSSNMCTQWKRYTGYLSDGIYLMPSDFQRYDKIQSLVFGNLNQYSFGLDLHQRDGYKYVSSSNNKMEFQSDPPYYAQNLGIFCLT